MTHALIIDDQEENIEVLGLLLQQENASYTALTSQRHLEDTIRSLEHLDVIFLDLEIPASEGYHAMLDSIRTMPEADGVPIVAYTVHTSEIEAVRQAGFDHFLAKPLNMSDFPSQLAKILNGQPVWSY